MATGFQTTINQRPALGVQGDKATLNPCVYTTFNPLAEGPVVVGTFVWTGTEANLAKNSGTGQPLGIVERNLSYWNYNIIEGASLAAPDGSNLQVARKGDYYTTSKTTATRGQKVFATLADGTIQTGAAGATIEGAIETPWTVDEGGAAGDLIVITSWTDQA